MRLLSDRYELLEQIGAGAAAQVFRARDRATDSIVAVKLLSPHLGADAVGLERFRREVQITRALRHPRIVPVYDLAADGDQHYLVMAFVSGVNLKEFIALHAPVPVARALAIVRQILEVLDVCHAQQVVHRDLKPQNIIVGDGDEITIVDFGIARMATLRDLTQTGVSLGSPEYMAPELFAERTYDPRSDLYAVGVIAFEVLVGRLPFAGDSLAMLYRQHLSAPVPPIGRADVPAWIQHFVERLLCKQSYARYQSAAEALEDLAAERVILRALPELPKRECLQCGARTLKALPACTFCGYSAEALQNGDYELRCAADQDMAALGRYFENVFGLRPPSTQKLKETAPSAAASARLVVTGIDRLSAELIKRSAQAQHIYLEARARTVQRRAARKLSTVLLVCIGGYLGLAFLATLLAGRAGLGAIVRFWISPQRWDWLHQPGAEVNTVCWLAIFALATWAAVGMFRRQHLRPVYADPQQLRRRVERSRGWVTELLPYFQSAAPAPLKGLVAQLVEKLLLLEGAGLSAEARGRLEMLLASAAGLAGALALLDIDRDETRLAELASRYAGLETRERAATDERERARIAAERAAIAAELEAASALEDSCARLSNKLTHVHSVFNAVVGRGLVLRAGADEGDLEQLDACRRDLEEELRFAREAQRELERAA